jgi:hypothetical protein
MISANGWQYFNMPTCIPAGHYLMRAELIGERAEHFHAGNIDELAF